MLVTTRNTVIVTGAARGIGLATARRFAAPDRLLVLVDIRDAELQLAANACEEAGAKVLSLNTDLTARGAAEEVIGSALEAGGKINALINNAGIELRKSLKEHTADDWSQVLDVNLTAAFRLSQAAASALEESRGAIVNVTSVAVNGFAGQCAYDASKGALASLTRSLCVELGPNGVRVNSVAPGFIETEMVASDPKLSQVAAKFTRTLPISRPGSPEEVANAIYWLASDEASYVSGHTLFVDGGWLRR